MSTYILSIIFAAAVLLLAALISNMIQFEGGSNPKDSGKRKMWFWIFAILNPIIFYSIAAFVMAPSNRRELESWNDSLPIATIVGFVVYIILGFILSKIFKNGKIGNWFILIWGLFLLNSCATDPTKCECKAELERVLQVGKTSDLSDKCDRVYGDVTSYMYEDCPSS